MIEKKENVKETSRLANEYGTDFVSLYYRSLDTKRHVRIFYIYMVKYAHATNQIEFFFNIYKNKGIGQILF